MTFMEKKLSPLAESFFLFIFFSDVRDGGKKQEVDIFSKKHGGTPLKTNMDTRNDGLKKGNSL